jgi:hypothetical protein
MRVDKLRLETKRRCPSGGQRAGVTNANIPEGS